MNKRFLIIFLVTIFPSSFLFGCMDCKTSYQNQVKPEKINGVIIGLDSLHNHGIPLLKVKNTNGAIESYGTLGLLPLWHASHLYDSIYKAKNSLEIKLITKDTTLIFYPICDGDTLK